MVRKQTLSKLIPALALVLLAFASCKKEAPTLAKIYVQDTDGAPFANAEVRVYGESTTSPHNEMIMDYTLFTDTDGEVIFDFTDNFKLGQAGFAVLNIQVNSMDELLFGEGIIKVEEEKTNTETLIIQPL
ncbi:MAG: hypothetical protein IPO32_09720 [Crocinitomicaceae bacterium]|jgi:hypothetical protein|nr:hypothetical protein [Crocinitomicaceae bacterium]MBK9591759.1 hypothetical protein [Crocinitomicaceae bacterium]